MILAKSYRGQGLGRQLIEHVIRWAREQGFLRAMLLTDSDNERARRFYERLGFNRSNMVVYRLNLTDGELD